MEPSSFYFSVSICLAINSTHTIATCPQLIHSPQSDNPTIASLLPDHFRKHYLTLLHHHILNQITIPSRKHIIVPTMLRCNPPMIHQELNDTQVVILQRKRQRNISISIQRVHEAPLFSSSFTISSWPSLVAIINGVFQSQLRASAYAPWEKRILSWVDRLSSRCRRGVDRRGGSSV